MASKVSASSLISSLGPSSARRVSRVFALICLAAVLTRGTGRSAIPANQYAPAPPSTATSPRPTNEMFLSSKMRASSSGLDGLAERQTNGMTEKEADYEQSGQ